MPHKTQLRCAYLETILPNRYTSRAKPYLWPMPMVVIGILFFCVTNTLVGRELPGFGDNDLPEFAWPMYPQTTYKVLQAEDIDRLKLPQSIESDFTSDCKTVAVFCAFSGKCVVFPKSSPFT